MRIALIADVHGNLVALERVFRAIDDDGVDEIICLGDVAATGPQPHDVVRLLDSKQCWCVLGNADADMLSLPRPPEDAEPPRWLAIHRWCADRLSEADRVYLESFQPTHWIDLDAGQALLAYHGSPQSFDDLIYATTPDIELGKLLSAESATIFAGGHTHVPFMRALDRNIVINPGSVGLRPPNASYALIDTSAGRIDVTLRFVPLLADEILHAARASGMPELEWWSSIWK